MIQIELLKKAIATTSEKEILDYKSKIFPLRRSVQNNMADDSKVRKSAVLALLYPKNDSLYFALTKRPDYPGAHGGQISFPGGKVEESDKSLKDTALRETWEEIGVQLSEDQIIHSLEHIYIPPSNFLVYPFLAVSTTPLEFKKDDYEVESILEIPCDQLHVENIKTGSIESSGNLKLKISYYELNSSVVWGATASILAEVHAILENYRKEINS